MKNNNSTLLLEIGVEEIPARFLPNAIRDLGLLTAKILAENSIRLPSDKDSIKPYATPRRLAVIVKGIPERQKDRKREVFGPPKKVAFNPDGTLTKAGIKFAESVDIGIERLTVKQRDKGEYIVAEIEEKGLPLEEILPEVLKKIILSLNFPKSMRWGNGSLRFVRPIRWIVAMLNNKVIPLDIDGIKSSNKTRGHRFLSPKPLVIKDINEYESMLRKNYVVVDQKKRSAEIEKQIDELAKSLKGSLVRDNELLTTVTHLVEYPHAVLGRFDEKYLELPEELLITVMKTHQKCFSLKDKSGRLINSFIVISNTKAKNDNTVRTGAERVIKARLEDARFYYEEDKKKRLDERVEDLKRVVYHEKLGSLYDKTMRVKNIAEHIAVKLFTEGIIKDLVSRAATLSKADLVTGVVREFPELQGVMGRYYALHGGEKKSITDAIKEHYFYEEKDIYRMSIQGAMLNIADKMDNIVSFFSIGLKPTGSEDPFALRRQAIAVITILREKGYNISIQDILDSAISNLTHITDSQQIKKEVSEFFEARIEPMFSATFGIMRYIKGVPDRYPVDVIESVISLVTKKTLNDLLERMNALQGFKSNSKYADFLTAIKRVRNIIPKKELPSVMPELFIADEEKRLYEVFSTIKAQAQRLIKKADYRSAINEFTGLIDPINKFFDSILVMDKDERIRDNRLSLLNELWKMVSEIADFSKLSEN